MPESPTPGAGMATATWQTILAIDFDKWAAETYRANFPGVTVECDSVANRIGGLPRADVILGGPPCQPFSDAGENDGENDERDCIPDFCAAVADVLPRQFLMENVDGLLRERHIRYFGRMLSRLEETCHAGVSYPGGYVVQYRVFDAVAFGVPQFRSRVWVWGIRKDVYAGGARHAWPTPTHAWPPPNGQMSMFGDPPIAGVTVRQALADLGNAGTRTVEYRWSDEYRTKHPPIDPDAPCQTVIKQWYKGEPNGCLAVDVPSHTIGAGSREPIQNWKSKGYIRRLTPAECLRLQSAPDSFVWPTGISKTNQYKVIGNGWASGMAAAMNRALKAADPASRTVIDLFCGGGLGACGWHGRYWSLCIEGIDPRRRQPEPVLERSGALVDLGEPLRDQRPQGGGAGALGGGDVAVAERAEHFALGGGELGGGARHGGESTASIGTSGSVNGGLVYKPRKGAL